jgi:hypothetical protein
MIILGTIEGDTIMFTGDAPGMAMTGLAIGTGIESHLAIVPMIITVGMGMIPGGTTGDMTEGTIGRGIGKA